MKKILTHFLKNQIKILAVIFILSQLFVQCKKSSSDNTTQDNFSNGVFIINEGQFSKISGTVNFFNKTKSENLDMDIFKNVNSVSLGDVVQSMSIANDKGYIVVNNSNKVEVVSISDFKSTATISGLKLPRYFLAVSASIGYISQWGSDGKTGTIEIVDLNTNKVINSLSTPAGPEQMVQIDNKVFVCCNGGYGSEKKVIVINTTSNTIESTIEVGDAATSIKVDKDKKVWVLCKGKYKADWTGLEIAGSLVKINPTTYAIETTLTFPIEAQPALLETNQSQDALYYKYKNNVYKMNISNSAVNTDTPFVTNTTQGLYGLGVDKSSDDVYIGYAPTFTNNGIVYRYTSTGTAINNFASGGIGPNGFVFR